MAQAVSLSDGWEPALVLATPQESRDRAGLSRLPSEWGTVDRVVLDDIVIDHVVVGPNGVFAIAIDPDERPARLEADGLYRDGSRVTTTVKSALYGANALRDRFGSRLFAYPLLVTALEAERGHLDRLAVIGAGGIPEAIWSHPGRALTRSRRGELLWSLHGLAGR